jgi:large subunit ribosomal protein L32e
LGEDKTIDVGVESSSIEARHLLRIRRRQKAKKPEFIRQESWRYKRVKPSWRRPKGIDSKMRLKLKGRPKVVDVGYRSPKAVRGLSSSGSSELLVYNPKDLDNATPSQVVRIAHTVGRRKRLAIVEKAKALNLRIINAGGVMQE